MITLEGISDYMDVSAVVNGWQALVVCVFLIAVLVWPGVQSVLTNRRVKEVKKTLTTNNGGSTVKDAMDRIEAEQKAQAAKLAEHVEWSEGYVRDTAERLDALEARKRGRFRL